MRANLPLLQERRTGPLSAGGNTGSAGKVSALEAWLCACVCVLPLRLTLRRNEPTHCSTVPLAPIAARIASYESPIEPMG